MDTKDKMSIEEYRATHPECRWCIHNIPFAHGMSSCRVRDAEFRKNGGIAGKIRASLCRCYCIK